MYSPHAASQAALEPGNLTRALAREIFRLACGVQDRVGLFRILLKRLDRFCRWQYDQFDFAAIGFALHLLHNRQGSSTGTDDQPLAFPGYVFLDRERRVSKGGSELFGWFLIPLPDVTAIDHDVILVGRSINADRPKGECLKTQTCFPRSLLFTAVLAHKSSAI
jgi:hypothetical protein